MGLSFWANRNVFVTGATGLLGSWLVEELIHRGASVICLVRDRVPASRLVRTGLLERSNIVHGELEDYAVLLRALNEYEIDSVFHLGAQTIVETASRSPLSTFEANIAGTWNLLEACRSCPKLIQRAVVASSDKAYGGHEDLPYTEATALEGRFPYDVSKSCADLISFSYFHTYKVPLAITRCGNLFGGGDLNFNRLIPGTIRSALRGEAPIIRSDGKFIRDYFYVRDAVNAYLQLAEKLPDAHLILKLCGKSSLAPKVLNEASHEIPRQFLDCSKAHRMLRWRPKHTLEEGLSETIKWYEEFFSSSVESQQQFGLRS
jgi:CDP-glucose 4,6-dehydratase